MASAARLTRQLSFVAHTIDDVDNIIQAEEEGMDWFRAFWHVILVQPPTCRMLANRSLPNWVAIYNRWQATAKSNGGVPVDVMNGNELQDWLAAPPTRIVEIVRLFDPKGYAKFNLMKTSSEHSKIRLPILPLFSACVMMSQTLTNRQKLRFLFGVFDKDDKGGLTEEEFATMTHNLLRGLACAFGMAIAKEILPPPPKIHEVAIRICGRIRAHAPPAEATRPFISEASLDQWFLGKTFDPFALPFALFLERFSIDDDAVDPDVFQDEPRRFRLSHTKPVENPLEAVINVDPNFLTRFEVLTAREIYQYCQRIGDFTLSHTEVEHGVQKPISVEMWCGKLSRALEEMDALRGTGVRCDFVGFLRKLCPKATPAHIRMYHAWLQEFDSFTEQKQALEMGREVLQTFRHYNEKPVMTDRIRNELDTSFAKIDRAQQDRITTSDLKAAMEVGTRTAKSMMRYFDTNGDGFVDRDEYAAAMCPQDFRYRPAGAFVDDVFGVLIANRVGKLEKFISEMESKFAPRRAGEHQRHRAKLFLKPQAPEPVWKTWNDVFDLLDPENTGKVGRRRLKESRLLCPDVCDYVFDLLAEPAETQTSEHDDGDTQFFNRDQLLAKLLDASDFRLRGS